MQNSSGYVLQGTLAEDGEEMDFPLVKDGTSTPWVKARAHQYADFRSTPRESMSENLMFFALPSSSLITIGQREIPVPFIEDGSVKDVKRFKSLGYSLMTDGMCFVKIHPFTPYRIRGQYGELYHSFEMLETSDNYKKSHSMHFDPIYEDERKGLAVEERGERIITMPGVRIFPANCAYRLPGWIAGHFNGSPEFAFAFSEFNGPRKGEVLHSHTEIMEPYIGMSGTARLFVEIPEGDEIYMAQRHDGSQMQFKGTIFELGVNDVLLPMPGVAHRFLFDDKTVYPNTACAINYASVGLEKVSEYDRVVLEGK
ncbi:MAG TPA: hypothetical protein VI968_01530 [archaeon]|nr:hypothetical protein [archaeon]